MRDARQRKMKIIRIKAYLENLQMQFSGKNCKMHALINPFTPEISVNNNSPYCLLYKSCGIGLENLVLNQLIIPQSIFVFILVTCLHDTVLIIYCKEKFCLDHSWELKS